MNAPREQDLFDRALDLPAGEREAFVRRECGDDTVLCERVLALLAAHEVTTAFLPKSPRTLAVVPEDLPGEAPGDVIGRYKLLERVGEGGCGVVYVAEQTEPVRRRVALKVIKLGMDTKAVVARFEAERQALALMDHPNIAKVLDAGATDRGRPYFVMELVRGIPITHYCDQNNLGTQARLGLFIQVCHAIQHAHQKGIIHRDIKPSNILVTVNDGVPVPKVIDFGIAKATEGRLTDSTVYTQLHQFIGTPAYMSPEQAEMTSLDIDTRSDIYSLGVLLYELLAGKTPFDAKELLAAGLEAMRRIVREQEPARPSTKLATLQGDELSTTAKRRATEPPKLVRELQGDLDWIVMKCLEKDRTRRYETANGLAADLRRHLDHEPVVARPPSTGYRLQKALQRHRAAFAVTALFAVVLLGATAFSAWQARVAREAAAAERLAKQDATARAEAERIAREEAEALAKFLGDVFRSPDPKEDGRNVTVAATLGRAAERVERELAGQPARRAALQTAIAETYLGLSLFREAKPLFERVLGHHRAQLGDEHTNTLHIMAQLAESNYGVGQHDEALRLRREVRRLCAKVLGPEHPDTLAAMSALASSQNMLVDERNEAIRLVREVHAARQRIQGQDHIETKKSALDVFYYSSDPIAAGTNQPGTIAAELLEWTRREKGPLHPDTITALTLLALYTPFDTPNSAMEKIRLSREALEVARRVFGPEHSESITIIGNLGWFLLGSGRFTEAVETFEETVQLAAKTFGPDHERTLSHQMKLAEAYLAARRPEEAVRLGEETLRRFRQANGDARSLPLFQMLAGIYMRYPDASRRQDSFRLLEEAVGIIRLSQPDSSEAIWILQVLASAKGMSGHHEEAAALLRDLEAMLFRVHGKESRDTGGFLSTIGSGYFTAGRYEDAIRVLEMALPLCQKFFGTEHVIVSQTAEGLAAAYRMAGRIKDWQRTLEVAGGDKVTYPGAVIDLAVFQVWTGDIAGYERTRDRQLRGAANTTDPTTAERAAKIASLQPLTDPAMAESTLKLAQFAVTAGTNHQYHVWFKLFLGMAEHRSGHFAAAEQALLVAEQATESAPESHRPRIQATARLYRAMSLHQQGRMEDAHTTFLEGEALMKPLPVGDANPVIAGQNQNDVIMWLTYREAAALLRLPDDAVTQSRRDTLRRRVLEGAVGKNPPDAQAGIALAALQLWTGDAAGYAATRDRMLEWAKGTNRVNYWEREWVAKLASLTAEAPATVRADALTLARQAVEQGANDINRPWHQLALGMAEFRAGNDVAAEAAFAVAVKPLNQFSASEYARLGTTVDLYRALNLHRQGRVAEARAAFRAAEARMTLPPADGSTLPVGSPDRDLLVLWLAHREARALLQPPEAGR